MILPNFRHYLPVQIQDACKRKLVENKEYSQYLTNYAPTELGIAPEQLIYLEPALAGLPTYSLHGKNVAKEDAISDVKFLFQVLKHSYWRIFVFW